MEEIPLAGGLSGGAVLVDGTVRRRPGPWTPAVHALLTHLERRAFPGAPRVLGFDERGRQVLSYLPGEVVGNSRPWPRWTHTDDALVQAARWLRQLHLAVADFRPPADAVWREGGAWHPGLVVGHNDAAPYNAAWLPTGADAGRLTGFFDWDFAAPVTPLADLAFTAFGWVPLHARHVVAVEGFTNFEDRERRLRLFLDAYGWNGEPEAVLHAAHDRVLASAEGIRRTAAAGDPAYRSMVERGVDRDLEQAAREMPEILA